MSDLRSGRERLIKGFSYRDESGFIIQTPGEFFFLPDEPLLMSEQKRNDPHAEICGVNPLWRSTLLLSAEIITFSGAITTLKVHGWSVMPLRSSINIAPDHSCI